MAYGDPYCGRCHQFMRKAYVVEALGSIQWTCTCTIGGIKPDNTKDPNCHNSNHDHYDPESPIVLARQAEYAAERQGGCICIGSMVDYTGAPCPVHPIVYEEDEGTEEMRILPLEELAEDVEIVRDEFEVVDGTPFFDTIDELNEILEDTNEQVDVHRGLSGDDFSPRHHGPPHHGHDMSAADFYDTGADDLSDINECLVRGHIWVKYGRMTAGVDFGVKDSAAISVMDWGPTVCLRCKEPAPEGALEGPVITVTDRGMDVTGKHACPGCNLRDLTMADAKEHIRKLQVVVADAVQSGLPKQVAGQDVIDIRREAAAFLRMSENKIRAWRGEPDCGCAPDSFCDRCGVDDD